MADKESKFLKGLKPNFREGVAGDDLRAFEKGMEKFDKSTQDIQTSVKDLGSSVGSLGGNIGGIIKQVGTKVGPGASTVPSKSIIKSAAKNVFEFPVFVSSSVPLDFATAINSLLEQVYASYVQMAISQNPVVSANDMKSGNPFRRLKSDTTKYLEYTDPTKMFYAHEACHNVIETEDAVVEFDMIDVDNEMGQIITESLDYQPLSEFEHFFTEASTPNKMVKYEKQFDKLSDELADLVRRSKSGELSEDEVRRQRELPSKIREARANLISAYKDAAAEDVKRLQDEYDRLEDNKRTNVIDSKELERLEKLPDEIRKAKKDYIDRINDIDKRFNDGFKVGSKVGVTTYKDREEIRKDESHAAEKEAHIKNEEERAGRLQREEAKHRADMKAKAPQMMDETKINKLNSMKPLMMTVSMRVMDNNNTISDLIDYVVGVKTHCRMVDADILPDFAEYPSKTMNLVSRKARWRAGEIKFIDYLFSRKEKKQAAYDARDPKRKWYHRLYNLAHIKGSSKIAKKITGSGNVDGIIPDATLILTKADVDMIESVNGIDLLKGSKAASICKELFLIAMVVVDTDAQSIKILMPDIANDYEVHSLASVNKQLATLDTSNSVSREVSRMMRER